MKNREFFKDVIDKAIDCGDTIAIVEGIPCLCSNDGADCYKCICHKRGYCEDKDRVEWLNSEYETFKERDLVEVSNDGNIWEVRRFRHTDGFVYYASEIGDDENIDCFNICQKYGTLGKEN